MYWINQIKIGSSIAKFFCLDRTSTKKHYLTETNVVVDAIMMISFDFGKITLNLHKDWTATMKLLNFKFRLNWVNLRRYHHALHGFKKNTASPIPVLLLSLTLSRFLAWRLNHLADIYLFKISNGNTKTMCEFVQIWL